MKGRINHLIVNVNRYEEAQRFYGWLLPKVGYPNQVGFAEDAPSGEADGTTTPAPFGCTRPSHVFAQTDSIVIAWGSAKSLSPPTVATRWMSWRRKSNGTAAE